MSVQSLVEKIAGFASPVKAGRSIHKGTVSGKSIEVNGKAYNYDVAVDIDVGNGDVVYVMFSDNGRAVVIGR